MDYTDAFSKRAQSYLAALRLCPNALCEEFRTAIEMCELKGGDVFICIPSSCENVAPYVPHGVTQLNFETSKELAVLTNTPYSSFFSLPLPDASVHKILTLASLHHCTNDERSLFYKECMRVLKPGGTLIIGDVIAGTKIDTWLNSFVNAYNSHGHNGQFWSNADSELLSDAGFIVRTFYPSYTWNFDSAELMIEFCKKLFHLDRASDLDIKQGLVNILGADFINYKIPWSLIYFIATKT